MGGAHILFTAVEFLAKAVLPTLLGIWLKALYIDETDNWFFGREIFFWAYFAVLAGIWISTHRGQQRETVSARMQLRHVLLSIRKLAVETGERIDDARGLVRTERSDPAVAVEAIASVVDFQRMRRRLLEELFLCFSNRNVDLDKHFRVSLAEVDGDVLRIVDFANSENVQPRSAAEGMTFQKKQGTAGWAWELGDIFAVPNVDKFRKRRAKGKLAYDYFITAHPGHQDIKSIVAIPIRLHSRATSEIVGVVCIDADVKNAFDDSQVGKRDIRIRAFPYIRALEAVYAARDFLADAEAGLGAPRRAAASA